MQVQTTQYIFPPRPKNCIPRSETSIMADMNWVGQLKYNGTRILVKYLPSLTGRSEDVPVELWNRHGNRLWDYTVPEDLLGQLRDLHSYLPISPLETSILDGELIDMKHKALKDTIAIWDILVKDSEHLVGSTYQERYDLIAPTAQNYVFSAPHGKFVFGKKYTKDILRPVSRDSRHWDTMWDVVNATNEPYKTANGTLAPLLEGLVFKNPLGTLEPGWKEKNNEDWLCRSRVKTGRHLF